MNERINEIDEGSQIEKERAEIVKEVEPSKVEEPIKSKEELLKVIYDKEGGVTQSSNPVTDDDKDKVNNLIKESSKSGIMNALKKVKKLGFHAIDSFHDTIVNRNNKKG